MATSPTMPFAELTNYEFDCAVFHCVNALLSGDAELSQECTETKARLLQFYKQSEGAKLLHAFMVALTKTPGQDPFSSFELCFRLGFLTGWDARTLVAEARTRTV